MDDEKKCYSRINISVDAAELAYLRAKQAEGYGISQYIRYLLEREQRREEVRKAAQEI